jgi:hypothetical protein
MIYRAADAGEDDGQTNATVILRRSPSWGEPRRMGHKRRRRSFETPRKRAAPLAITAKPLRGDDGEICVWLLVSR